MKRVFLIIVASLVAFNLTTVLAQSPKTVQRHGFGELFLYGEVKSLTVKNYKLKDYFGEIKKDGSPKVSVYKFNSRGDCVESNDYYSIGTLRSKMLHKYDSNGDVVESATYDYDGKLTSKSIYRYDDQCPEWKEMMWYESDGSLQKKDIRKYDQEGHVIECISYNPDGSQRLKLCYTYDSNGNQVEILKWRGNGEFERTKYKYDSDNNKVEQTNYDSNNVAKSRFLYIYDSMGNMIREECYNSDSSLMYLEICTYDLDGNLTELSCCNSDGSLREKIDYKYDSKGNLIESICFKSDAMIPLWLEEREIVYFTDEPTEDILSDEEPPFMRVEVMPSFMGGDLNTFRAWFAQEFQIPEIAAKNGIQGRVVVQFVIEKDGRLTNIEFLQSPDRSYEEEVTRVLKKSPRWTSGRQDGETVRVRYILPINCTMQ